MQQSLISSGRAILDLDVGFGKQALVEQGLERGESDNPGRCVYAIILLYSIGYIMCIPAQGQRIYDGVFEDLN